MRVEHKCFRGWLPVRRYYFVSQPQPNGLDYLLPTAYLNAYQAQKPAPCFFTQQGDTLITDLTQNETALFAGFAKKTRNEIRRFERGSDYVLNEQAELTAFIPAYRAFARSRGLSLFNETDISAYGAANLHLLTMEREGKAEIFDLYLLDPARKRVDGFLSCSPIDQTTNKAARRQLSIARRYLLWASIRYFKAAGFTVYDWGGYAPASADPVISGINAFKCSFKGKAVPVYHHYSPAYWLMENVYTVYNRLRHAYGNQRALSADQSVTSTQTADRVSADCVVNGKRQP